MTDDPNSGGRPRQSGPAGRRPHRPREHRRTVPLTCHASPDERDKIKALAARMGITCSELLRRAILGRQLPKAIPALNRDAWVKLGPVAADLNQRLRAIQEGGAEATLLPVLEQLRREVAALREELLGCDPQDQ